MRSKMRLKMKGRRERRRGRERALYLSLVWVEVPESLPSCGDTGYIGYIETRLCDAVVTLLMKLTVDTYCTCSLSHRPRVRSDDRAEEREGGEGST